MELCRGCCLTWSPRCKSVCREYPFSLGEGWDSALLGGGGVAVNPSPGKSVLSTAADTSLGDSYKAMC